VTVVVAVILVNVAVSLLAFRALRTGGPDAEKFLFVPHQVARGRNRLGLLLAHFAHAGAFHLVFNMLALFSFADVVVNALGSARFLLIYAVSGLGADLVVFILRKNDPAYRCLGASGSVFGVVMAAVVLDPTTSIILIFAPIPIPGPVFMLGYVIVSLVLMLQNRRDGVSHEGHLGGTLVGFVATAVLAPRGLGPLIQWFARWV